MSERAATLSTVGSKSGVAWLSTEHVLPNGPGSDAAFPWLGSTVDRDAGSLDQREAVSHWRFSSLLFTAHDATRGTPDQRFPR